MKYEQAIISPIHNGYMIKFPVELTERRTGETTTIIKTYTIKTLDELPKFLSEMLITSQELEKLTMGG